MICDRPLCLSKIPTSPMPMMISILLDDNGFVDMHDLERVTTRVAALETTLKSVNTNLTNLNTLFQ